MSGQIRYSDEFKIDAAAQVTERDYPVKEVAERLGVHHVTTQNRLVARYVGFSGVVEYGSRLASFVNDDQVKVLRAKTDLWAVGRKARLRMVGYDHPEVSVW